jgi:hypothetical protein
VTQTITTTQVVALDVRKLAGDVLLLVWNSDESPARGLRAMCGGEMIRPPVSHTAVPLGAGRVRNLMAVRLAGAAAANATIAVCDSAGHTLAESGNRSYSRSRTPDLDPAGLLAGFDGTARVRAIRFLTDVCGSIFQLGANAEFIANCRQLVGEVSRNPGPLLARCTVLDRFVLCAGVVKAAMGERLTAVVVGAGGIRRAAHNPMLLPAVPTKPGLVAFAILLDKASAASGTNVVLLAENGMACRQIGDAPVPPPVLEWLLAGRRDAAPTRRYLLDCLARLGAQDPHAASLLRELQVLGPQGGRVVNEKACPISAGADLMLATGAGLFVSGWFRDPHGIVEALEIETQDRPVSVPADQLIRFAHHEADLRRSVAASDVFSGFATFVPSAKADTGSCRLALRLRSGGRIAVAEGPSVMPPAEARDAILAAIPPDHLDVGTIAACIEPALAALRPTTADAVAPQTIAIGALPAEPVASLIVPMSSDLDVVRCRTGMFATDPAMAKVEVIYVVDRAQHRAGAERLLRALHTAYGTPMRVVVASEPADSGSALNAAAKCATAPVLAFLGRGVLPEGANWLESLVRFLDARPRCGLVGARLAREDHSLAAAGAEFAPGASGDWDVTRLYQGFPCDFDAAVEAAPVATLPSGCLVIRRSMFDLAGGFAEDYFTPLRQAADLGARVRSHGFEVWRAAAPMLLDLGTDERLAAHDVRAELDRRLLEQRWRDKAGAQDPAGTLPAAGEPQSQSKQRVRTRRRRRAA